MGGGRQRAFRSLQGKGKPHPLGRFEPLNTPFLLQPGDEIALVVHVTDLFRLVEAVDDRVDPLWDMDPLDLGIEQGLGHFPRGGEKNTAPSCRSETKLLQQPCPPSF